MKRVKFREFMEIHASLMPTVNFAPGSPAMIDLFRNWNSMAILFPERCADVIIWGKESAPFSMDNDMSIEETLKILRDKPLGNLPNEYRSDGFHQRQRERITEKKLSQIRETKQEPDAKPSKNDNKDDNKDAPDDKNKPVDEPEIPKNEEGVVIPSHVQKDKEKVKPNK